ncbi:DUF1934 domain-containing protein [Halalkalibacterium halodurans]|uniref:DUF1934 domain-containing protein n=1 Tax=Halalkalibacterium halodurans TaxID=86665 RepID=UPI002AA9B04B|nr:DUF1934 domain-containing protein [Halalkalibacterium halodurans]MDY7224313.1 DUF1934 domain-containing protein [Halalkalibacterium halodurans]MDY7243598.1 DUF1934 domain-containing protein [Halalkalibacterium halodurans]
MKKQEKRHVRILFQTKIDRHGEIEDYEFTTKGELYHKGTQDYLRFQEVLSDQENVQTTLKWDGRELVLIRQGDVLMRQSFLRGIQTSGRYVTPQISWESVATTESVIVRWPQGKQKGVIHLRYHFSLQGQDTGIHDVRLTLEEE